MTRRGLSIVGMLVSLMCLVALMAIALPALQQGMTGKKEDGGKAANSAWGLQDQINFYGLMQALNVQALGQGEGFPHPSVASGSKDPSEDTTANLYSLLIMERFVDPSKLVSKSEESNWVEPDEDYKWSAYDPHNQVMWDPNFVADLSDISNVSYAHMPLHGDRLRDNWGAQLSTSFPLFGNRGPEGGIESEDSYACFNGKWGGYVVFGDGHVDFFDSPSAFYRSLKDGSPDGLFSIDDGNRHADAILGFTSRMDRNGPVLQWD